MAGIQAIPRFVRILTLATRYSKRVNRFVREEGTIPPPQLHRLMGEWGQQTLATVKVSVTLTGSPVTETPSLLLGNHVSYLDIPLLMSIHPVVFIAKKEVSRWPVFGPAAASVNTVLVERDSKLSRQEAGEAIAHTWRDKKQSIVIFPSGTTTTDEATRWRWGAFAIAKKYNIPVQPFRIAYRPMRKVAYLKEDTFASHLWQLLGESSIEAHVELAPPFYVKDPEADCEHWWQWNRASLLKKLAELGETTAAAPFR